MKDNKYKLSWWTNPTFIIAIEFSICLISLLLIILEYI